MESFWTRLAHTDLTGRRIRTYPELAEFGDATDQVIAFNVAQGTVYRMNRVYRWAIAIPVALLAAVITIADLSSVFLIATYVGMGAIMVYWHRKDSPLIRSELRRLLDEQGLFCTHCDYYLLGNLTGLCPECGERICDENHLKIALKSYRINELSASNELSR